MISETGELPRAYAISCFLVVLSFSAIVFYSGKLFLSNLGEKRQRQTITKEINYFRKSKVQLQLRGVQKIGFHNIKTMVVIPQSNISSLYACEGYHSLWGRSAIVIFDDAHDKLQLTKNIVPLIQNILKCLKQYKRELGVSRLVIQSQSTKIRKSIFYNVGSRYYFRHFQV